VRPAAGWFWSALDSEETAAHEFVRRASRAMSAGRFNIKGRTLGLDAPGATIGQTRRSVTSGPLIQINPSAGQTGYDGHALVARLLASIVGRRLTYGVGGKCPDGDDWNGSGVRTHNLRRGPGPGTFHGGMRRLIGSLFLPRVRLRVGAICPAGSGDILKWRLVHFNYGQADPRLARPFRLSRAARASSFTSSGDGGSCYQQGGYGA
jgi:hypothetical protein